MENNWSEFWNKKQNGFDVIMSKTTAFFQKQYSKNFPLEEEDILLDFGCGPGNFLNKFILSENEFVGVDISKYYIDFCKTKFKNHSNFSFHLCPNDDKFYKLGSLLNQYKVNRLVCLSVLQYFPDEKSVETFLDTIFQNDDIHVVLGDIIPKNHNIIKDTFSVFWGALTNGFLLSFIRFIVETLTSGYLKKDEKTLLTLDSGFFENYAKKHNLNCQIMKLTIPVTRYSVVLSN